MVSVIIPNYNHASFLKQRIDSVLNQDYHDFEVIILDDCSTDTSWKDVLLNYKNHPKVKILERNIHNSGSTFKQWEKGLQYATGEYIWIAESDDYADPLFLQKMIGHMSAHPDAVLGFCDSKIVDAGNCMIDNSRSWSSVYSEFLTKSGSYSGNEFCEKFLIKHCVIPNASAVIIKNERLLELVKVSKQYKVSGDWYLWFKLLLNKQFVYVNEDLNFFRTHSGTVRKQKEILIKSESLNLLKIFFNDLSDLNLNLKWFYESYFEWSFKNLQWSPDYILSFANFKAYFRNLKFSSLPYFFYKVPRILFLKLK